MNNIFIPKLVKTKNNSKYLIGYLNKVIRPLHYLWYCPKWGNMLRMSEYVKIFKVRYGDKDKNNKLISFSIDDDKLLEKHKTMSTVYH